MSYMPSKFAVRKNEMFGCLCSVWFCIAASCKYPNLRFCMAVHAMPLYCVIAYGGLSNVILSSIRDDYSII